MLIKKGSLDIFSSQTLFKIFQWQSNIEIVLGRSVSLYSCLYHSLFSESNLRFPVSQILEKTLGVLCCSLIVYGLTFCKSLGNFRSAAPYFTITHSRYDNLYIPAVKKQSLIIRDFHLGHQILKKK